MTRRLTVAVAQPHCNAGDLTANAAEHARIVTAAGRAGAGLVVFPELSLTGYDVLAPAVGPDDPALGTIAAACAATATVALVGAPVDEPAGRAIATLRVDGTGAVVVYRKMSLGGDEVDTFVAGRAPSAITIDGWRVGVGICKDTRIAEHLQPTFALGIDLYVAGLVHHAHELHELDERAARIVAAAGIPVAFASAAGDAGPTYRDGAGGSTVWDATGAPVARATDRPGEVAIATLTTVRL